MTGLILFGSFAVMLLCNVSIAVALGLSSVLAIAFQRYVLKHGARQLLCFQQ